MLVTITVRATQTSRKHKVQQNSTHLWYDVHSKQMHTFYGGQLKFAYDANEKRVKPYVVPLCVNTTTKAASIWRVREWFDENGEELGLTLIEDTPTHVTFALPKVQENELKKLQEAAEIALYAERFDYTVEEHKKYA